MYQFGMVELLSLINCAIAPDLTGFRDQDDLEEHLGDWKKESSTSNYENTPRLYRSIAKDMFFLSH